MLPVLLVLVLVLVLVLGYFPITPYFIDSGLWCRYGIALDSAEPVPVMATSDQQDFLNGGIKLKMTLRQQIP